jgi:AraC-like DNA-binding protein
MNYLKIDSTDFRSTQEKFLDYFSSSVESFDFGNRIVLTDTDGKGEIYFLQFNDGISIILYDCNFKEGLNLEVDSTLSAPLYIFYAMTDGAGVNVNESSTINGLSKYQPVIIGSALGKTIKLSLPKDRHSQLLVFKVDRKKYVANRIKLLKNRAVLNTIFEDRNSLKTTIHACSPNLYIADLVHRLSHHTLKETYRIFVIEAEINLILGHILAHYATDVNSAGNSRILTKKELEKVRELASNIARNPGESYTIRQLTSATGLAPYKLQEGFRHLYKRTAADFIRDKRLMRAAELLGKNELNVTEVVAHIGLNSNSYFSKIFKEKYNCCPKEYQDQIKQHEIFEVNG